MDAIDPTQTKLRVLVASHSHPAVAKGGAEIAAHNLFLALQARPDSEAWFLGCSRDGSFGRLGSAIVQPFSDREFLYCPGEFDWFKFANHDPRFPRQFEALLAELDPQVVHFHHYINFGVEVFQLVRRALPNARIVLTLHEYLGICHHYGQMITSGKHNLCYEASYTRCHGCFPEWDPSDFFLRRSYILQFLDHVDQFIAPSRFLADRYVRWGVSAERMTVVENVVAPTLPPVVAPLHGAEDVLRIGFFGQISWLKGCNVMFDAADILARDEVSDIVFDIHGDYRSQMPDFQKEFLERLDAAGRNVAFHGPYENELVDMLMAGVDAVLVPSVWWENSPVVIQEALRNRRPVICSAIGGMAEKVRDGVDGFHFRAGSGAALAGLLRRLAKDRQLLLGVEASMARPVSADAITDRHLELYRSLFVRTAPRLDGPARLPAAAAG